MMRGFLAKLVRWPGRALGEVRWDEEPEPSTLAAWALAGFVVVVVVVAAIYGAFA